MQNRSAVDTDISLQENEPRGLFSAHSKDEPNYFGHDGSTVDSDDEDLGDWLEGKTLIEAAAEINVMSETFVLERHVLSRPYRSL